MGKKIDQPMWKSSYEFDRPGRDIQCDVVADAMLGTD